MAGKGKQFEPGNKLAKGGARKGAGRKPSWFKELCEEELAKNKAHAVRLIGEIARGEGEFERAAVNFGTVKKYTLKPSAGEVVAAAEFLRDSAQGRPAQAIQHSGEIGVDIFDLVDRAERERGLPRSFDDKK